ncbi:MAG TPA: hypothetical protein PKN85_08945 [Syntrophorhabdaceae bacterium]|nr:hypothetical protein [Syntrophorhabdaceae bacterium]
MSYLLLAVTFIISLLLPASSLHAGPVVAVKDFQGSGPSSQLGSGLSSMVETELANSEGLKKCGGSVVEWKRRKDVVDEIERQQGPGFDPKSRAKKGKLLEPTVFVVGDVITSDTDVRWSIKLVDPATGRTIGRHDGSVPADKDSVFEAPREIAENLGEQICRQGMEYTSPAGRSGNAGTSDSPAGDPSGVLDKVNGVVDSIKGFKKLF